MTTGEQQNVHGSGQPYEEKYVMPKYGLRSPIAGGVGFESEGGAAVIDDGELVDEPFEFAD